MKTMKTLSRRIAALLLVVTVGITALAPAASAAWAAAAATAAEPDADAEHFLILNRATSAADAISYHICRAGVIFCLFLLRLSILSKSCLSETYAR